MRILVRSLVAAVAVSLGVSVLVAAPAWGHDDDGGIRRTKGSKIVPADEAILQPPATPVTVTLPPDQGCRTLLETGDGDCAVVTGDGQLVFVVEPLSDRDPVLIERPWAVRVYAKSATVPDGWDLVLENPDRDTYTFAEVTAKVADITGDGGDEVAFGFRASGTGQFLDFDVVLPSAEGGAVVAAHQRLDKGTVVVKEGSITSYTAFFRRTDGNCCPSFIIRDTIKYRDGRFRIVTEKKIPTKRADIPPGNLG